MPFFQSQERKVTMDMMEIAGVLTPKGAPFSKSDDYCDVGRMACRFLSVRQGFRALHCEPTHRPQQNGETQFAQETYRKFLKDFRIALNDGLDFFQVPALTISEAERVADQGAEYHRILAGGQAEGHALY